MILDHVPCRANAVVVPSTAADTNVFCHGDLNVIDVLRIPQRFEELVRKSQRKNILNRLFAQIVINAKNRVRRKNRLHHVVEFPGRGEVTAERLLNDNPAPRISIRTCES
ncbi:unannotated protein [freshwater metagenome]|uniref:Unannotated protein n=1 Tax=freshwater metagenome TaxID=449393 RepID=A0A6J6DD59_9ZZZZ